MKIGVIVGRFQTPTLHEGHIDLIKQVKNKCDQLVILLGIAQAKAEPNDPLDFKTRRLMLAFEFPDSAIYPVHDNQSDEVWSNKLDIFINNLYPYDDITLYGSRGSFLTRYSGQLPTEEIVPKDSQHNATELRKSVSIEPVSLESFRKGVIYSCYNRYPISFQAVDIAILNPRNWNILLGRKPGETKWRFPGGFVDPTDPSLEMAAKREATEECGNAEYDNFKYMCSARIDDWRYRNRIDKIMTAFFTCELVFGHVEAGDDLQEIKWFSIEDFIRTPGVENLNYQNMVENHHVLMNCLVDSYTKTPASAKN